MASSSSSAHVFKYDVFLSFRGEDTRHSFTRHLQMALEDMKIDTYNDDKLKSGDEIGPSLLKAIEQSEISVIIFSVNYASSSWCLDELAHILQCKELYQQYVIPIFYGIDPSHVRHQRESYAAAFSKHEERFKDSMDKVLKWKRALETAANLSGFDSNTIRDESKLIKAVVKAILMKLKSECSSELKHLVGIESRIQQIESLLCIDKHVGVRTVGIWGMGGIGKTTLADSVFNRFSSQFEASCFLANVREESEKCGLYHLRDKLLQNLLKDKKLEIDTPSIGSSYAKRKLSRKKVLVVLDDVNDVSQLEFLVGDQVQFGSGSRIIITTRDKHQLKEMQRLRKAADNDVEIYDMEELNVNEAIQLFHLNEEMSLGADYAGLVRRVVHYAAGIPLALKIWGSLFRRCKSKQERDSFLKKLKEFPDEKLQNVYMVSYEVLGKNEKEIFLDIACFHKNKEIHDATRELDACGLFADIGIQVLIDMSLISIKARQTRKKDGVQEIWMHDVVQEMGWAIVCKEFPEDPGKRSRLYTPEVVCHVLENSTGTEKIQGMILHQYYESINLPSRAFEKMHNLKLLKFYNEYYITGSFNLQELESLPNSLRILWWFKYPFKSLPPKFSPVNLVELSMPGSQLQRLWNEGQSPRNLKSVDLQDSKQLLEVPDLSKSVNIERIDLQGCKRLVEVPSYFENLVKLTYLNLRMCSNLRILSEMPRNMEFLLLVGTAIEELPASIWSLEKLVELDIEFCKGIINHHPLRTWDLTSFESNRWSSSIDCFPRLAGHHNNSGMLKFFEQLLRCSSINENSLLLSDPVECMEDLHLRRTDIKQVPSSIDNLVGLKRLSLYECKSLESIPNTIYNLNRLESFKVDGSCRLKNLPPCSVVLWSSMRQLSFAHCESLEEIPDSIFSLTSLQKLSLSGTMIKSIPPTIKQASRLRYLYLNNCECLESLPELPCLVKYLDASGCTKLKTVSGSMTALTQGLDQICDFKKLSHSEEQHLFCKCVSLDEHARSNIMNDVQLKILRTATACHRFRCEFAGFRDRFNLSLTAGHKYHSATAVWWGNEIPRWFSYQTEGSSIKIRLPLNWCDKSNFLGLALCAVVMVDNQEFLSCTCDSIFKTINGESHHAYHNAFTWAPGTHFESDVENSDHVVVWYDSLEHRSTSCCNATEASFEFFQPTCDLFQPSRGGSVKRCGVCLLYAEGHGQDFLAFESILSYAEGHGQNALKCTPPKKKKKKMLSRTKSSINMSKLRPKKNHVEA